MTGVERRVGRWGTEEPLGVALRLWSVREAFLDAPSRICGRCRNRSRVRVQFGDSFSFGQNNSSALGVAAGVQGEGLCEQGWAAVRSGSAHTSVHLDVCRIRTDSGIHSVHRKGVRVFKCVHQEEGLVCEA